MERFPRMDAKNASGARRQAHDTAQACGSAMPSSFIRTVTVGSGIGPDLLTTRRAGCARGLGSGDPYRRWGIAPRPEDVC